MYMSPHDLDAPKRYSPGEARPAEYITKHKPRHADPWQKSKPWGENDRRRSEPEHNIKKRQKNGGGYGRQNHQRPYE